METNSVEVKRNFPKEYRATVDKWLAKDNKSDMWINIEEAKPEIPNKKYGIVVDVAWFDKWYEEANPGHGWEVGTAIWNGKEFLDLFTSMGDVRAEYLPTCNHIQYWQYRPQPPQVKCKE